MLCPSTTLDSRQNEGMLKITHTTIQNHYLGHSLGFEQWWRWEKSSSHLDGGFEEKKKNTFLPKFQALHIAFQMMGGKRMQGMGRHPLGSSLKLGPI